MPDDYTPRLSIELREDQYYALKDIFPHGTQKVFFQALVDGVISLHQRGGFAALGPVMSGHIDVIALAKAGHPYTYDTIKEG